jgi:hypothetical protein
MVRGDDTASYPSSRGNFAIRIQKYENGRNAMIFERSTVARIAWRFFVIAFVHMRAVAAAAPPTDVDNAALLYYQATFVRPEVKDYGSFNQVLGGADPNAQVREYFSWRGTRDVISLVEAATRIAHCDWGIRFSEGDELSVPASGQLQQLANLLDVYARVLACDGKYRVALEHCLMIRRFAKHMGNETPNTHHRSTSFDAQALASIKSILGRMPPDVDTLVWLRDQLREVQGTLWLPTQALTGFRNHCVNWLLHEHADIGATWRKAMLNSSIDEDVRKRIEPLTGDELFKRACESYNAFLKSALKLMEDGRPYAEKHAELRRMTADLHERGVRGDPISIVADCMYNPAGLVVSYYESMIRHAANFNITMAAIEIYLVKAKTGQLPTMLPANLPKDPYSANDFEYATTKEGFRLQYRSKGESGERVRPFDFAVR